jgi:hypothetical protein
MVGVDFVVCIYQSKDRRRRKVGKKDDETKQKTIKIFILVIVRGSHPI